VIGKKTGWSCLEGLASRLVQKKVSDAVGCAEFHSHRRVWRLWQRSLWSHLCDKDAQNLSSPGFQAIAQCVRR